MIMSREDALNGLPTELKIKLIHHFWVQGMEFIKIQVCWTK